MLTPSGNAIIVHACCVNATSEAHEDPIGYSQSGEKCDLQLQQDNGHELKQYRRFPLNLHRLYQEGKEKFPTDDWKYYVNPDSVGRSTLFVNPNPNIVWGHHS
eukprot:scaffold288_cov143-Ochromonas_danica.AAC.4